MGRAIFAIHTIGKIVSGQDTSCPYCGGANTVLCQRKKILWQLRQCPNCSLLFRWPKDSATDNRDLYAAEDNESVVYERPNDQALVALKSKNYHADHVDYSLRVKTVRALIPRGRLLDYGASWGYGVDQFRKAGYDAVGLEISAFRASIGREKLGVTVETTTHSFADRSFDIIHTAHVLEHIPDLHGPFADFGRLLRPGGYLVIFVPNAGSKPARELGVKWGGLINEKHVLALTPEFFAHNLPEFGFSLAFGSSPHDRPLQAMNDHPSLDGEELLVVGRRS